MANARAFPMIDIHSTSDVHRFTEGAYYSANEVRDYLFLNAPILHARLVAGLMTEGVTGRSTLLGGDAARLAKKISGQMFYMGDLAERIAQVSQKLWSNYNQFYIQAIMRAREERKSNNNIIKV